MRSTEALKISTQALQNFHKAVFNYHAAETYTSKMKLSLLSQGFQITHSMTRGNIFNLENVSSLSQHTF